MANATLDTIRTKVRRLTRSPSPTQLSNADIDEYISTFMLYDMPEHLRLFSLRDTFSFYTNPYQDKYQTDTASFVGVTTNQLYDFRNKYVTTHTPVFIAGIQSLWSQSRAQFYANYPLNNSIDTVATGSGILATFTGTVPHVSGNNDVLLQNNVLFSAIDVNGQGWSLVDRPVHNTATGNPSVEGNLYLAGEIPAIPDIAVDPTNTINYATGVFTITFPVAPLAGSDIHAQTVPQTLAKPNALLYFDNAFWVRPVPDKPYRIDIEVNKLPTELIQAADNPELKQWWQYIAYGAAKKVLEDRTDTETVMKIMPEFKMQERLVLRRTVEQQTKERTATIYTDQTSLRGSGGWQWGNF